MQIGEDREELIILPMSVFLGSENAVVTRSYALLCYDLAVDL